MIKRCIICGKTFNARRANKYCSSDCREQAYGKSNKKQKLDTICWSCQNACGKCSWSKRFEPVKGWEAKPTVIKESRTVYGRPNVLLQDSYIVINCPEYIPDERK